MPSVYIKTYGCQMNERDSEQVAAQLVAKGYTLAASEAMADVILLNTCSVRDMIVDVAEEANSQSTIREHLLNGASAKSVTAFVSIMQGCNQYCTFCIVPYTRGEERSRTIPDIVAECRELVARGVKEITLLGQIVTSFGKRDYAPQDGKSAFVQLLEAVHAIEDLQRIRFTSPHPKGYGDDLVE